MNAPLRSWPVDADPGVTLVKPPSEPKAPTRTPKRRRGRIQREADLMLHNHATERWMISYSDFMTLLFAFFVVMYAISSVNEGRYRVLSGSLATAFSTKDKPDPANASKAVNEVKPVPDMTAVAVANAPEAKVETPAIVPTKAPEPEPVIDPVEKAELIRNTERAQRMQKLASDMDNKLQTLAKDGQVKVTRGARGIAIEINAAVLFDPARAELKPAAYDALRSVASALGQFVEPLQIEGHTDDIPISTREFKSNWELSAARAASVARFLVDQGIAPSRLGIAGYAEFRPLVANGTPEARARNRRVTLVVLSADDTKPKEGPAAPEAKEPRAAAAEPEPAPDDTISIPQ